MPSGCTTLGSSFLKAISAHWKLHDLMLLAGTIHSFASCKNDGNEIGRSRAPVVLRFLPAWRERLGYELIRGVPR